MKKITDLTENDFPGVEPAKFQEWKSGIRKTQRNMIIVLCLWTVLIFTVGSLIPAYRKNSAGIWVTHWASTLYQGLILPSYIIILWLITLKSRMQMKKMGFSIKMLRQTQRK